MPKAYIIAPKCDIIPKVYHPFRKERISLKKPRQRRGFFLARLAGFEPATYRFVAGHSIH